MVNSKLIKSKSTKSTQLLKISKSSIKDKEKKSYNKKCIHGRSTYYCRDCGGKGFCMHSRRKYDCRECGGKGFCSHNKYKSKCELCKSNRKKDKTIIYNIIPFKSNIKQDKKLITNSISIKLSISEPIIVPGKISEQVSEQISVQNKEQDQETQSDDLDYDEIIEILKGISEELDT